MNPFDALGLPATTSLTDADVRAAWRSIAAATHPDQDGGDPAAYAAAAAAYQQLRTAWGRGEVLADLAQASPGDWRPEQEAGPGVLAVRWRGAGLLPARIRHGRPWRLAVRTVVAVTAAVIAVTVTVGTPSAPAVAVGCLLWWACTARGDLAPPPGR